MELNKLVKKKYSKDERMKVFERIIVDSGCTFERIGPDENQFFETYIIKSDDHIFNVHVYIRSISGAGWSDKPEINRIQIPKIPQIPRQRSIEFRLLCGVATFDGKDIIAIWDPTNYLTHNTVCSCYVFFSSFDKAYLNGYYFGLNKGKEVMTCTAEGFSDLLREISSRYC